MWFLNRCGKVKAIHKAEKREKMKKMTKKSRERNSKRRLHLSTGFERKKVDWRSAGAEKRFRNIDS